MHRWFGVECHHEARGRGAEIGERLGERGGILVILVAGVGGIDREPHDLCAVLLLQRLHVAAAVVLLHEGAAEVVPLENDGLAAVVGELHGLAREVGRGEVGRDLADGRGGEGGACEEGGDRGGEQGVSGHGRILGFQREERLAVAAGFAF